jgi:hypothetical protein
MDELEIRNKAWYLTDTRREGKPKDKVGVWSKWT